MSSQQDETIRCLNPNCGAMIPKRRAFCSECGEPMFQEKTNRRTSSMDAMAGTMLGGSKPQRPASQSHSQQNLQAPVPAATRSASLVGYKASDLIPQQKSSKKLYVILGLGALILLTVLIALLFALKVW